MAGYIGTQPVPQATQTRDAFTATNNQTSFPTSGYTPEFLDVFLNGVKLAAADYTATNGSDVVLAAGATTGDILEVVSYGTFEVLNPTFDGNVTFTGNASFGDNDKAIFGDGNDLQIYHDGSNSYIKNNTGMMRIHGTQVQIKDEDNNETLAIFNPQGSVDLYYDNAQKFSTTSTGIDVTGTVAATAYTGDGSALTGTGSPSIDDNGNATAITIDSNENVLIGKASADGTGSIGHDIRATGLAYHTVDGGDVKVLNRLNSNGSILSFRKDGTTVGSIGTPFSNAMYITGPTSTGSGFVLQSDDKIYPAKAGARVDNYVDLGGSVFRYKDAYLSGGVYLGGTGSANKLEDYEEGTWTPSIVGGTVTNNNRSTYVKIGNLVTVYTYITFTSPNNGNTFEITGIPFNLTSVGAYYASGHGLSYSGTLNTASLSAPLISPNDRIYFHYLNGSHVTVANSFFTGTTRHLIFSITYQTDA